MKCHAGVEYPNGAPCPKCNAKLGEVCWPGINADLLELARLRKEIEPLRSALKPFAAVAESDIGRDETDADIFQPMRSGYNREPLITVGDMRRAASALSPADSGGAA
jgi:hypothetical protein